MMSNVIETTTSTCLFKDRSDSIESGNVTVVGGGAWPFLVGGVICLVNSDNERDY